MKLNPGDKIGIISPSSFLRNREAVELGLDYLRSLKRNRFSANMFSTLSVIWPAPPKTAPPILHRFYSRPGNKSRFLHWPEVPAASTCCP